MVVLREPLLPRSQMLPLNFDHARHVAVNCLTCHHNYADGRGFDACIHCHRGTRARDQGGRGGALSRLLFRLPSQPRAASCGSRARVRLQGLSHGRICSRGIAMKIAAISDIHGNLFALDAVLADIERRGADLTVNLGDILSGPLLPGETADRLMALDLPTIAGNHERQVLTMAPSDMGASDRYAHDMINEVHREWLAGLPPVLRPASGVFLCHATPQNDVDCYLEDLIDGELRPAPRHSVEKRTGELRCLAHLLRPFAHPASAEPGQRAGDSESRQRGNSSYEGHHPAPHNGGNRFSARALCARRALPRGMEGPNSSRFPMTGPRRPASPGNAGVRIGSTHCRRASCARRHCRHSPARPAGGSGRATAYPRRRPRAPGQHRLAYELPVDDAPVMSNVAGAAQHRAAFAGPPKHVLDLPCEFPGLDFLIGVKIPQHPPAIQIARTYRCPPVAEKHLGVQKAGPIFVDHDAAREQPPIEKAAGAARRGRIGMGPGKQQAHVHAAARGTPQAAAQSIRRPEVGPLPSICASAPCGSA